jgi:Kef-type K+ transport system membrane component KefB
MVDDHCELSLPLMFIMFGLLLDNRPVWVTQWLYTGWIVSAMAWSMYGLKYVEMFFVT